MSKSLSSLMFGTAIFLIMGCSASRKVEVVSYKSFEGHAQTAINTGSYQLVGSSGTQEERSYTFANSKGDTATYSVSFDLNDDEGFKYVKNVVITGCSTSNASDYEKVCGYESDVKKLERLPKDAEANEFSPGKLVFNLVGLPLIILGGLYTVLIIAGVAAS